MTPHLPSHCCYSRNGSFLMYCYHRHLSALSLLLKIVETSQVMGLSCISMVLHLPFSIVNSWLAGKEDDRMIGVRRSVTECAIDSSLSSGEIKI